MTDFLKCDAFNCDHFELTPVTIDVVDKPCPKCGANLCTAADFLLFKTFTASSHAANDLILREAPDTPLILVATNVHGGKVNIATNVTEGENPFPNHPPSEVPEYERSTP